MPLHILKKHFNTQETTSENEINSQSHSLLLFKLKIFGVGISIKGWNQVETLNMIACSFSWNIYLSFKTFFSFLNLLLPVSHHHEMRRWRCIICQWTICLLVFQGPLLHWLVCSAKWSIMFIKSSFSETVIYNKIWFQLHYDHLLQYFYLIYIKSS